MISFYDFFLMYRTTIKILHVFLNILTLSPKKIVLKETFFKMSRHYDVVSYWTNER